MADLEDEDRNQDDESDDDENDDEDDEGGSDDTSTSTSDDEDSDNNQDNKDDESVDDNDEDKEDKPDVSSIGKPPLMKKTAPALPLVKKKRPLVTLANISRQPPKMRIKLSLKLPTKANARAKARESGSEVPEEEQQVGESDDSDSDDDSDDAVKATVVGSDEDDEGEETLTAVVEEPESKKQKSSSTKQDKQSTASTNNTKRRSMHPSRPIKMPPIHSPGLLMLPPHTGHAGGPKLPPPFKMTKDGYTTPASIFDYNMNVAGYSVEQRTKQPHRGSSVRRVVGDMFDSNVKLALHFPALVPPELLSQKSDQETKAAGQDKDNRTEAAAVRQPDDRDLPAILMEQLQPSKAKPKSTATSNGCSNTAFGILSSSRKRRRPWTFMDMVPVSLTVNYPSDYVEKRAEYIRQVHAREAAIVAYQEAEDQADREDDEPAPISIKIPPIPTPPSPPRLSECEGWEYDAKSTAPQNNNKSKYSEDDHPVYIPRAKERFVAHLDSQCFHITDGRYFGLLSNNVADPNFVGANAPGIAGVNASGGAGLATSTTGSGGISATALTLSSSSFQVVQPNNNHAASNGSNKQQVPVIAANEIADNKSISSNPSTKASASVSTKPKNGAVAKPTETTKSAASTPTKDVKNQGPKPTATAADLRKVMDQGGSMADKMRVAIIRAAVHAARSGRHAHSFVAPNGETYPDVSKAFASHAGIKPCQRCKNNKQGSYHCRVRRQHKDADYDGGNSPEELVPLFSAPLESLASTSF